MGKQDNLRVQKPIIPFVIYNPKLPLITYARKPKVQATISDTKKTKFYADKQKMSNSSLLGQSAPTNYDPSTEEGQNKINAAFDVAANQSKDLIYNAAGSAIAIPFSSLVPRGRVVGGTIGRLEQFTPFKIGEGAEFDVFNNSLGTVLKIGDTSKKEILKRSTIPNSIKTKFIGYVKAPGTKLKAYTQNKVKVLSKDNYSKYIGKLDKAMEKSGFKRINDPQVQYRAYTNGKIVIDDLSPGNIGLTTGNVLIDKIVPDFMKQPKIIDMAYQTIPEWRAMGYKLQRGGKIDWKAVLKDPEYKALGNFKIYPKNLSIMEDSLHNRRATFPMRIAVLSQAVAENGGSPDPHGNGATGTMGWRGERAIGLPKDLAGQTHKLMVDIYENPKAKDWSHGGKGTGVNTGREMRQLFLNTNNVQQATKAFMKGYVRPEKSEHEKRLKLANILKRHVDQSKRNKR